MRISATSLFAMLCVGAVSLLAGTNSHAQRAVLNVITIALKSGESTEVGNLYWTSNCKSILTGTPTVEILDGPPGITASVKEETVIARASKCAAPVKGAKLYLAADHIEDQSFSTLTLRITYKTRDGERKLSEVINLELFP